MMAEWMHHDSLIDGSLKKSTLCSRNVMVKVTWFEDMTEPTYRVKILLEPMKGTPNACPFAIYEGIGGTGGLQEVQRRSLEILQQYLATLQTEIKEHLKTTITKPCLRTY